MNPKDIVEWKLTAPGIWTRMSDDKPASAKKPTRKIASLMADELPPETHPQPGKAHPHRPRHMAARA
jgi:hypothetical protein